MWLLLNKNDTINHNINIAFGYCIILQNVLQTKNTYDIPNLVCDLISFHHPNPFSSRREILERWKPLHRNIRSNPNPANGQCIGTLEVGIFLNYVVDCALISSPYLSIKGRSVMFKPPQAHCPCSFRPAGFGQWSPGDGSLGRGWLRRHLRQGLGTYHYISFYLIYKYIDIIYIYIDSIDRWIWYVGW